MRRIRLPPWLGPLGGLAFVLTLFTLLVGPPFLSPANLNLVAVQSVVIALGALGMTLVIVGGGIDLSVGSQIALTTVTTALAVQAGLPPLAAACLGVLTAGVCGWVNGLLVAGLRIVPFIVTLGMLGMARGAAKYFAHEQKVDAPLTFLNELMAKRPEPPWLLVAPGLWLTAVAAVGTWWLLTRTVFGRHVVAVGANEEAARLCGVRVGRVKVLVYTFCGLLTGAAGVMQFARLSVGDPTVAVGKELDIIAAVVIGGGSLAGGEGTVAGTLLGTLIMAFLRSGCDLLGLPNYVQDVVVGAVIVTAAALDRWRHRRA